MTEIEQLGTKRSMRFKLMVAFLAGAAVVGGAVALFFFLQQLEDTPIIVRDDSIGIVSRGVDLNTFTQLTPNILVHANPGKSLGKFKINGSEPGQPPCAQTRLCAVEFVWYTGTPGQEGYAEHTVVVWSGSPGSKGAHIYSSVPFSSYTYEALGTTAPNESAYRLTDVNGAQLTFKEARLIKVPVGNQPAAPLSAQPPLCNSANCEIEMEYR